MDLIDDQALADLYAAKAHAAAQADNTKRAAEFAAVGLLFQTRARDARTTIVRHAAQPSAAAALAKAITESAR